MKKITIYYNLLIYKKVLFRSVHFDIKLVLYFRLIRILKLNKPLHTWKINTKTSTRKFFLFYYYKIEEISILKYIQNIDYKKKIKKNNKISLLTEISSQTYFINLQEDLRELLQQVLQSLEKP